MPDRDPARRWRLVRAPGVAIPASVRRFNQRARARRLAAARPWLIAGGILALAGLASWLVFGSSVLGVERIRVTGSGFVGAEGVRSAARIRPGTPLATLNTAAVAARVRGLAPVASVQVSRHWPHTIVIAVTLRQPVAAVPVAGTHQYVQVDAEGVPFRTVSARHDLPIIKPGGGGAVDLSDPAVRAAVTAAAQILVSLPPKLSDQLVRLDAPSASGVVLVLSGGRSIVWGDSSDNAQKARVAESLLTRPGKVIDVSAPTVVTIR